MNAICIITARGGSKRIPGKNKKSFLGRPIICYSIEAALSSGLFEEVMVSTDDEEIAEIARKTGASVPFMRSEAASNDYATTDDVLLEVLEEYEKAGKTYEYMACIYPTAPFVTGQKLKDAVDKRRQQMQMDYPDVLSRCALLLGAGLTLQGSFRKMVEEYRASNTTKRYVYEELAVTVQEMENGVTEAKAVENFGKRTQLLSYMKFSGLISQNLRKGSRQLLSLLENERINALAERKEAAKRLGEQAGTKLLIPMMLMLVTVFIIILVPAFMSF